MDSMDSAKDNKNNAKNYHCENCDFKTSNKYNFNKHKNTAKHKKLDMDSIMDSEKVCIKNAKKFYCEKCHFETSNKYIFNKHKNTLKHNIQETDTKNCIKMHYCICGKKYKYDTGLYKHKKTCKGQQKENIIIDCENNKEDMKELVMQLIKQNNELQKTINDMIPNIGNNNNSNNLKQKFNINVFLNEKCKDALSMDDFIDKIEISMKNLLTTKEKGQVHGISNIIIENMNKLSLYERPMHCTDKKRETLYVKNNTWEKDENKTIINKALKNVERKQMQNINVWLEEHPNYMNNSQKQEEFAKLLSECGKSVDDGREKIIKNVCEKVFLDKEDC